MIKLFKSAKFQIWINIAFGVASILLIVVAVLFGLLASVSFVSWLSLLALVYGSLSGISASLVYLDAVTGFTLNTADKQYLDDLIDEKINSVLELLVANFTEPVILPSPGQLELPLTKE